MEMGGNASFCFIRFKWVVQDERKTEGKAGGRQSSFKRREIQGQAAVS